MVAVRRVLSARTPTHTLRRKHIKSIPTEYVGVLFRSRLEAHWAGMFDRLRWRWTYEPDLQAGRVIPDFLMDFSRPVIIECKPALTPEDCETYRVVLVAKMPQWLAEDVAREIRVLRQDLGADQALLERSRQDLARVTAGQNPRGHTRRILVAGVQLHERDGRITLDGDHGFCVCCGAGDVDHIGLAAPDQHCLVCGADVQAWVDPPDVVDAWRAIGAAQQWRPKRRRRRR